MQLIKHSVLTFVEVEKIDVIRMMISNLGRRTVSASSRHSVDYRMVEDLVAVNNELRGRRNEVKGDPNELILQMIFDAFAFTIAWDVPSF